MRVLHFPKSRPSVLVLNDCPDTLKLLTTALQAAGFRAHGVTIDDVRLGVGNGELPDRPFAPDVVVYDIGRGADSDWAHLRRFTELPEMERKPLVITTTSVVKVEGQRDAVYVRSQLQFASAPYDLSDLVTRVSAAIGLPSMAHGAPLVTCRDV